jgi:hypothetical protein
MVLDTTPITFLEHKILMAALRLIENPSFETWGYYKLLALMNNEERRYGLPYTLEIDLIKAFKGVPDPEKPGELKGGLIKKGFLLEPLAVDTGLVTGQLVQFNWPSVENLVKVAAKYAPG